MPHSSSIASPKHSPAQSISLLAVCSVLPSEQISQSSIKAKPPQSLLQSYGFSPISFEQSIYSSTQSSNKVHSPSGNKSNSFPSDISKQ